VILVRHGRTEANTGGVLAGATPGITLDEAGRARYSGLAALNRLGASEEIASVALFLASDLSSFVSGVTLNVDGGI